MISRSVTIRYEQAVYGSFPFWDRGYAVLAQSPGCRPEWLAGLRLACQRFGERPAGVAEAEVRGLFALRAADGRGPWMIVGVASPGSDDRGRPGALAFHALFVSPRDYRRAKCDPFALAGALRHDWTAADASRTLPAGTLALTREAGTPAPVDPRVANIAGALATGRRVAIEAAAPIDVLARQVWRGLPERVRRRASLATWAFGNANRFDLVALPRLGLDASTLDTATLGRDGEGRRGRSRAVACAGGAAVLAGIFIGLWWRQGDGVARSWPSMPPAVPADTAPNAPDWPPPDRAAYRDEGADPDGRRRVAEALVDLAERFGIGAAGAAALEDDPAGVMVLLAERLRYRGPWLSAAELTRLGDASANDRAAALALRWHAQMRRYAADRPLPGDFATGPPRWQLDTLAWSFHLDRDRDPAGSRRSAAEIPHALGEALAVDVPLSPTALAARYPALAAYHDFLVRLPRR